MNNPTTTALERAEKIIEAINDAGQLVCDWSICGNCGHVCLSDDYAEDTCPNCGAREDELDATVANILREAGRSVIAAALLGERIAAYKSLYYPEELYPDGVPMCCNGDECGCYGKPVEPPVIWNSFDSQRRLYKLIEARIAALEAEKKELEL